MATAIQDNGLRSTQRILQMIFHLDLYIKKVCFILVLPMEKDFDLKFSLRELVENITYILKTRTCSTIYKNVYIDMSFIMPRLLRMH